MNRILFASVSKVSPASMGRDLCTTKDPLLRGRKCGFESPQNAEGTETRLRPFNTLPTWPLYREDRNRALSAESAHRVLGLVRCSPCIRLIKGDGYPDAYTRVVCIDQNTDN